MGGFTRWLTPAIMLGGLAVLAALAVPVWLPTLGTALAVTDQLEPADVALVLEGTGATAPEVAEQWRRGGLVRDVVIVEAPVKTHALIAYWTDFVHWGLAAPSPTPPEHLRVVRAPSTQAGEQARAALAALRADQAHRVLVPGGGGIGSRLVKQELAAAFEPSGMRVRMVSDGGNPARDPGGWYQNAEDRRAVLDSWLQVLVPFLSGYEPGA
jgi:hypothetical protein